MICDSCRRDVDYVRGSFWHGEARICRECFAHWCDPDNDGLASADAASVGNYVRLRHGLPPLAAAVAILLLTTASTAHASRHCLDYAEAARTWPTRMLVKDGDGCWTYDHHPPRVEVPASMPETVLPRREPALMDRWIDADLLQAELARARAGEGFSGRAFVGAGSSGRRGAIRAVRLARARNHVRDGGRDGAARNQRPASPGAGRRSRTMTRLRPGPSARRLAVDAPNGPSRDRPTGEDRLSRPMPDRKAGCSGPRSRPASDCSHRSF